MDSFVSEMLSRPIKWVDGMDAHGSIGAINVTMSPFGPLTLVGHTRTKNGEKRGSVTTRIAVKENYVLTGVCLPGVDLNHYFKWLWDMALLLQRTLEHAAPLPPQVLTDQLAPVQASGNATANKPLVLAIVFPYR